MAASNPQITSSPLIQIQTNMPSPAKTHRKGVQEKNRKRRLLDKATSIHGRVSGNVDHALPRTRTVPDLLSWNRGRESMAGAGAAAPGKPLKLLLNVTVQRSVGAVHVLMPPEATVGDLIAAAVRQYVKEARRPVLPSTDVGDFDLHLSQFTLESLGKNEKLMDLGSRNFFLMCPTLGRVQAPVGRCSKEVYSVGKELPWVSIMSFLP